MAWTLSHLAQICGGQVVGDPTTGVGALCTSRHPVAGGIAMALDGRAADSLAAAGSLSLAVEVGGAGIAHPDPKGAFSMLIASLLPAPAQVPLGVSRQAEVHATATIHPKAGIGPFVFVGADAVVAEGAAMHPFSYLGERSVLSARAILLPHATVMENCSVGADAVVGPGTVIGAQGFGLHLKGEDRRRLPHRGGVQVGDHGDEGESSADHDRISQADTQRFALQGVHVEGYVEGKAGQTDQERRTRKDRSYSRQHPVFEESPRRFDGFHTRLHQQVRRRIEHQSHHQSQHILHRGLLAKHPPLGNAL
ncbi:hypothetical protein IIA16_03700 [bacterium]|nr:hypothetical protein [bacterium]